MLELSKKSFNKRHDHEAIFRNERLTTELHQKGEK